MVVLHHLERSRSHRILWLLEELELAYEMKVYQRDPKTMLAPQSLKDLHPLGKSPVITDGDLVIAESSVIVRYLLEKYGDSRLQPPKDTTEYWNYEYFLNAAEGTFMPYLFLSFVMNRLTQAPVPFFIRPISKLLETGLNANLIRPNLNTQMRFVDKVLSRDKWLAGDDFSAADIQMSYPLLAMESRSSLRDYPHIRLFLDEIKSRPAYKRAIKKGGPVEL